MIVLGQGGQHEVCQRLHAVWVACGKRGLWLGGFGCKVHRRLNQKDRVNPSTGKSERLIIGCYVDDLTILYKDRDKGSLYEWFTSELQSKWNVEDEGELTDLLNIEFNFTAQHVERQLHERSRHLARRVGLAPPCHCARSLPAPRSP